MPSEGCKSMFHSLGCPTCAIRIHHGATQLRSSLKVSNCKVKILWVDDVSQKASPMATDP